MLIFIHQHLVQTITIRKEMKILFYCNSYLKFQVCTDHDESEDIKQHKEDKVEGSTNNDSNNSSKKTNANITMQPNDKVLYFLLFLVYWCFIPLGEGG